MIFEESQFTVRNSNNNNKKINDFVQLYLTVFFFFTIMIIIPTVYCFCTLLYAINSKTNLIANLNKQTIIMLPRFIFIKLIIAFYSSLNCKKKEKKKWIEKKFAITRKSIKNNLKPIVLFYLL